MNVKKQMYKFNELIQKLVDSEIIFEDETECRIFYSIPNHNIADLKKCPTSISPRVYIQCSKCGATTKSIYASLDYCAVEEAAKLWNRRGIPDEVVSEVENAFIAVDEQLPTF